jgi:hypothetical protein
MGNPTGETKAQALGLDFYRRLRLQFYGSAITSDGGLLACSISGRHPAVRTARRISLGGLNFGIGLSAGVGRQRPLENCGDSRTFGGRR